MNENISNHVQTEMQSRSYQLESEGKGPNGITLIEKRYRKTELTITHWQHCQSEALTSLLLDINGLKLIAQ